MWFKIINYLYGHDVETGYPTRVAAERRVIWLYTERDGSPSPYRHQALRLMVVPQGDEGRGGES